MIKYAIFVLSILVSFNAMAEDNNVVDDMSSDYSVEQDNSDMEDYSEYTEQYNDESNDDYGVKETYDSEDDVEEDY